MMVTPVRVGDVGEHVLGVHRVAHGGRGEPEHLLAALVLGDHAATEATKPVSASTPGLRDTAPLLVEVLGQAQRLLVREGRQRCGAAVGVHHEQVPGVGADVEYAQPHGTKLPVSHPAATVCPCPKWISTFPRAWIEFTDPADEAQVFRCDLTWLTSRYQCIFGQGCQGIYRESPDTGCCTLGAHFSDAADQRRVAAYVDQLDDTAVAAAARPRAGPAQRTGSTRTRTGAEDPRGRGWTASPPASSTTAADFALGAGCALHALALRQGRQPAGDQAGRVLAAADPAQLPHRGASRRHGVHRGHHRRVRPPRLGTRRARPRLVLLGQHRGARRR